MFELVFCNCKSVRFVSGVLSCLRLPTKNCLRAEVGKELEGLPGGGSPLRRGFSRDGSKSQSGTCRVVLCGLNCKDSELFDSSLYGTV